LLHKGQEKAQLIDWAWRLIIGRDNAQPTETGEMQEVQK
jgi:hypothetical protein